MKILVTTLLLSACVCANAQTVSLLGGYKALEAGFGYTDQETGLVYGASVSVVDSGISQDRADRNDRGRKHEFKGDIVPAVFGNIGAEFDKLTIIGKIGGSYVSQKINGKPENDVFLALGIGAGYSVNEVFGVRASFDSVNSVMAGISLKF